MLTYLELLKANNQLKKSAHSTTLDLLVLNNITTNALKEYLEYSCASQGIQATIQFGDFDNIVQNAQQFSVEEKTVIVFWELANCVHGLEYKIGSYSQEQLNSLEQKIQTELQLTFIALQKAPLVIMNQFSALAFSYLQTSTTELEALANRLNLFCQKESPSNIKWINIDKCIASSGVNESIDFKGYLKNRVLYKHHFYWHYVQLIQPYFNAITGKVKKLLALDCDNTLWKGIIGEDGPTGIQMNENTYLGEPFAAAQYRALALSKEGVLIALVSKNNATDVDSIIDTHTDVTLTNESLIAKKVNWLHKSQNLNELANELNIGIDSFVFVDDSNFEIQHIRDQIPTIKTIQVPENAIQYYIDQQLWKNQFIQLNSTEEDAKKLQQYKESANRTKEQVKFENFDEFLASLDIELVIYKNDETIIPRMAQMTQKTNQFNLTTQRYTESQLLKFVKNKETDCFAFRVIDKFGDSGITGLCIVKYVDQHATIDSFLMSCRILGRNIEHKFIQEIINEVFLQTEHIEARYYKTAKNAQVADFYVKNKFEPLQQSVDRKDYILKKTTFVPTDQFDYIRVKYN